MDFLKKFETHAEYAAYINSREALLPNVSICVDMDNEIHYNRTLSNSLCFTAEENDCSLVFNYASTSPQNTFEYSTDGEVWNNYTFATTLTFESAGSKIFFRNTSETTKSLSTSSFDFYTFHLNGKIGASGDVTSLLNKNGNVKTIPCDYCFNSLFSYNSGLTTAPELPSTTLTASCYKSMFYDCKSLTVAPELPATTSKSYCYDYMFCNCNNISEVKCYLTDVPQGGFVSWLSGVSQNGVFFRTPHVEWPRGANGIPEGWLVNG